MVLNFVEILSALRKAAKNLVLLAASKVQAFKAVKQQEDTSLAQRRLDRTMEVQDCVQSRSSRRAFSYLADCCNNFVYTLTGVFTNDPREK